MFGRWVDVLVRLLERQPEHEEAGIDFPMQELEVRMSGQSLDEAGRCSVGYLWLGDPIDFEILGLPMEWCTPVEKPFLSRRLAFQKVVDKYGAFGLELR